VNLMTTNMRDTHETRLLRYLAQHKSITSLEAIRDLGNTRLAATICTLRKKGNDIASSSVDVDTRWGTKTQVAKYTLHHEPPHQSKMSLFNKLAKGYAGF
jgi:hypothetical protein